MDDLCQRSGEVCLTDGCKWPKEGCPHITVKDIKAMVNAFFNDEVTEESKAAMGKLSGWNTMTFDELDVAIKAEEKARNKS